MVMIQVQDTGIGIRPGDFNKLFKPFRQIETGLDRKYEGTGLGLSICKKLVELMGGEITVESEMGSGSRFTVHLPVKGPAPPWRSDMAGKKVLIIEDNEQNLYLTSYLLENSGYEVIPSRDGAQGCAMAGVVQPDVILLDIQLPGMDGYATARELRKQPRIKDTPIVAVTSYAMPGDKEKALSAGCTGYIEKPIDPAIFIDQLEEHLL